MTSTRTLDVTRAVAANPSTDLKFRLRYANMPTSLRVKVHVQADAIGTSP